MVYLFFVEEFKLDVMTREILKLRTVLNGLKKDRCKLNLSGNNNKTKFNCVVCLHLVR